MRGGYDLYRSARSHAARRPSARAAGLGDGLRPAWWGGRPGAPLVAGCRRLRDRPGAGRGVARLTEAFDWRAIFVFQVPVGRGGGDRGPRSARRTRRPGAEPERPERFAVRPALALALVSAALAAVALPARPAARRRLERQPAERRGRASPSSRLAAFGGSRIGGDAAHARRPRAAPLVGGGVLALAWLPERQPVRGPSCRRRWRAWAWGSRSRRWAATCCPSARRATRRGCWPCATPASPPILAIAAPIAAHQLDVTTQTRQGARRRRSCSTRTLPPQAKIELAPALLNGVDSDEPRAGLERGGRRRAPATSPAPSCAAYDDLGQSADDMLVTAVGEAFRSSFLLAGRRRPAGRGAAGGGGAAGRDGRGDRAHARHARGLLRAAQGDRPGAARDPGSVPSRSHAAQDGGISGFIQEQALKLLDSTACKLGSSREELVLALADKDEAKRFEREHGVDPRTAAGLLSVLLK